MNTQRLKGLLGLSVRAGAACFGDDACSGLARRGACGVLLLDGETAENTRKKYEHLALRQGFRLCLLEPGFLEEATGRGNRVMALRSGGLAEEVLRCL